MRRVLLLAFMLPILAQAQLLEIKQVIYGMDCAPCARGVEASIKRLDGVRLVTISLNNGTALIRLSSDNHLKLQDIRQLVSDNGFTPKEAEVTLKGVPHEVGDRIVIGMESGETFSLGLAEPKEKALDKLKAKVGQSVTIAGLILDVAKKTSESWVIRIRDILD